MEAEVLIRTGMFFGILLIMVLLELAMPKRRLRMPRTEWWVANLGIAMLSILLVRLDAVLRLFVVTPDMHRVHHSIICCETNSNSGFNLS